MKVQGRKVIVSRQEVRAFNASWPCSTLRDTRSYWFEFGANGDLVDTDCPDQDDGDAATAMAEDCKRFLFKGTIPPWKS
jgi:hypothetical protein